MKSPRLDNIYQLALLYAQHATYKASADTYHTTVSTQTDDTITVSNNMFTATVDDIIEQAPGTQDGSRLDTTCDSRNGEGGGGGTIFRQKIPTKIPFAKTTSFPRDFKFFYAL